MEYELKVSDKLFEASNEHWDVAFRSDTGSFWVTTGHQCSWAPIGMVVAVLRAAGYHVTEPAHWPCAIDGEGRIV